MYFRFDQNHLWSSSSQEPCKGKTRATLTARSVLRGSIPLPNPGSGKPFKVLCTRTRDEQSRAWPEIFHEKKIAKMRKKFRCWLGLRRRAPSFRKSLNPFRAPEPLPILNPSNFVPKNGFPVVEGLSPSVRLPLSSHPTLIRVQLSRGLFSC